MHQPRPKSILVNSLAHKRNNPAKTQLIGSVGDVVPILDAEVVEETLPEVVSAETYAVQNNEAVQSAEVVHEVKPSRDREAPSWRLPPPVRRTKTAPPTAHPE